MEITAIGTPGLGDNTYVVIHEGQAIIVDPPRDIDRFLLVLDQSNVELCCVLETHIHNDYVSGGRELAGRTGAWKLRPIHTPGHTPEHLSYLAEIDGEPVALSNGGSLQGCSLSPPITHTWDQRTLPDRNRYTAAISANCLSPKSATLLLWVFDRRNGLRRVTYLEPSEFRSVMTSRCGRDGYYLSTRKPCIGLGPSDDPPPKSVDSG